MIDPSGCPPMLSPGYESLVELPGRWWVAHTRSRFEKALARDLQRRGIGYFLPLAEQVRVSGGKKRRVFRPLFTSYVFLCGDEEDRYAAMSTDRVATTIEVTDQDGLIGELAAIEKVLRETSLELFPRPPLGRRCRIISGPFEGIEGLVMRHTEPTRIVLQLSVIGQGATMEIDCDLLEPCPQPPAERPRGRRRNIGHAHGRSIAAR